MGDNLEAVSRRSSSNSFPELDAPPSKGGAHGGKSEGVKGAEKGAKGAEAVATTTVTRLREEAGQDAVNQAADQDAAKQALQGKDQLGSQAKPSAFQEGSIYAPPPKAPPPTGISHL